MMKYHQLLKQLENVVQSITSINSRIDSAEVLPVSLKAELSQAQAILQVKKNRKKASTRKLILNQTDLFNDDQ